MPGILGHRDTIRTFSDIFDIINGRGMYSASVGVTMKNCMFPEIKLNRKLNMEFLNVKFNWKFRKQSRFPT